MSTASTTTVKEALPDALAKARANKPRSLWSDALRRLLRNKAAVLGLLFITLEIVVALAAPLVAPYHFAEQMLTRRHCRRRVSICSAPTGKAATS